MEWKFPEDEERETQSTHLTGSCACSTSTRLKAAGTGAHTSAEG